MVSLPEPPITFSIREAGVAVVEQGVGDVADRKMAAAETGELCSQKQSTIHPGFQI